jgi:hypothetical protein
MAGLCPKFLCSPAGLALGLPTSSGSGASQRSVFFGSGRAIAAERHPFLPAGSVAYPPQAAGLNCALTIRRCACYANLLWSNQCRLTSRITVQGGAPEQHSQAATDEHCDTLRRSGRRSGRRSATNLPHAVWQTLHSKAKQRLTLQRVRRCFGWIRVVERRGIEPLTFAMRTQSYRLM